MEGATERRCKHCWAPFFPEREAQDFCGGGECRAAYHKERYQREAHACPLCGKVHEPCVRGIRSGRSGTAQLAHSEWPSI